MKESHHFTDESGADIVVSFKDRQHRDDWYAKNSPFIKLGWSANKRPNCKIVSRPIEFNLYNDID